MNITSNVKGQLAISKVELRALELGFIPSRPLYDTRYDLIIDNSKSLRKVQVKYADGKPSSSLGAVIVKLSYSNRKNKIYTYNKREVDDLIVYIPKINKLCLIPKDIFTGKRNLCIRIDKPKNNQTKGVIFAEDYYW